MGTPPVPVRAYVFGPFRLSLVDRILERDGVRVRLTPKIIDTLFVLVENAGAVVTKDALMQAVWPDVTVVESGLTRNISILRKVLEEGMPEESFIETIPRRGYRFVAEVVEEPAAAGTEPVSTAPGQVSGTSERFSRSWWTAAVIVFCILASLLAVSHANRTSRPPVDPGIRIGEHLLYRLAPEQSVRAIQQFEQAVADNSQSAAAHAGLSIALLQSAALGVRMVSEVAPRAEEASKRALELDPRLPAAHYADALVNLLEHWRLDRAEKSFRRALELEPTSVQSLFGYTQLKFALGQVQQAIELTAEALRLEPASPLLGARYCQAFYYARDFHRAEAECRRVLDREPHYALAQYYLGLSLGSMGRTDEARTIFAGMPMAAGVVEADLAWLALRDGNRRPALQVLEQRRALVRQGKVNASAKLLLCAQLGEMEEGFEAIDAAIASHAVEVLTLNIDPRLDALRSDPRFPGVLRRVGLAPVLAQR